MKFVNETDEQFDVGLFTIDLAGGFRIDWSVTITPGDSASNTPPVSESGKYRVNVSNIKGNSHIDVNGKNATVIITIDANNHLHLKIEN